MKRVTRIVELLALVMLVVSSLSAQQATSDSQTGSSGTTLTFLNDRGDTLVSFEYVITGTPATASIVMKGCMPSSTCDTIETSTSTSSANHKYTGSANNPVYSSFTIAITFTGGTAPKLKVNRLSVRAAIPGAGSGGSGTLTATGLSLPDGTLVIGNVYPDTKPMPADPTNCSVGNAPTGIDKTGASKGCAALYTLPAQYTKSACQGQLGDGLNAITAGTYIIKSCTNAFGVTYTITSIQAQSDNAGTSTVNAANDAATGLLTGAITAGTSWVSGTQSGTTTIVSTDSITFTIVADGTSKRIDFKVAVTR